MKYSIIAAIVVLALARGSLSAESPEVEQMTQFFEDMKNKLMATAQELSESIRTQELANQAQTFLEDGRAKLEPLATQIHSQLKPIATNVEEQLKPLAANVQAQLQPMVENFQTQMEEMFRNLMEQAKAIGN
ncbi:type-4 ice-structuring protein-like [Lampris incognitus]|uniref:type-4 ice-structuring protein-like n=1 Tax=Lampris incognitus TaxID=2546036 RepID=UPI0024B52708|nr:type-4 ice-structuring protein-like [Lampris incognitus]